MDKRNKLLAILEKMDEDLEQFFHNFSQQSDVEFNFSPGTGKWSPSQILNHLILSEKYSLVYCQKKLGFKPNLKKAGFSSWMRSQLVKYYLLSPIRFKAPQNVSTESLPAKDTVSAVKVKWIKVRNDLRLFIESIPDTYLDKEVYKHPFGGRLSLEGMLTFFRAHITNHNKQIANALSSYQKNIRT